jgi:hypothetical protein
MVLPSQKPVQHDAQRISKPHGTVRRDRRGKRRGTLLVRIRAVPFAGFTEDPYFAGERHQSILAARMARKRANLVTISRQK